ncbi:signal peptidase I [Jeotgalibaca sp. MA1X17-3]|uniref:signal peptidase I n=1 Tax=Jeotgalibaca sp. MA1X17-3 TaxID=2908211 RepID=UPI001F16CC5F|nr:signal peptidase I [Jeotgalibaca sp. MA1X17-3]UJF14789.1 signal peptidase I [Jeotgalibaca sp. MA1X17-3]
MQSRTFKWLKAVLLALGIASFIKYFIFIPVTVEGISMNPTLQSGDHILYESFTSIKRFDIILFHDTKGNSYIKRVIGLPGESLSYQEDQLYIDSEPVDDSFIFKKNNIDNQVFTPDFSLESITGEIVIPEEHYFVLGDNRTRSKDSRMFGFVPKSSIEGKAILIFYPFKDFSFLN